MCEFKISKLKLLHFYLQKKAVIIADYLMLNLVNVPGARKWNIVRKNARKQTGWSTKQIVRRKRNVFLVFLKQLVSKRNLNFFLVFLKHLVSRRYVNFFLLKCQGITSWQFSSLSNLVHRLLIMCFWWSFYKLETLDCLKVFFLDAFNFYFI